MGRDYRSIILDKVNEKKQSFDDLRKVLEVKGENDFASFSDALEKLRIDGDLYLDKDGFYHIFDERLAIKQGQIYINKSGVGYVKVLSGEKEVSYMIPSSDLNGALPKDIVIIRPLDKKFLGHQYAEVEEIIKRDKFLEVFKYIGDGLFIPYELPIKMNVLVNDKLCNEIVPDTLVLLDVSEGCVTTGDKTYFYGNISKVIGHKDDPKIDEKAISYKYGFDHKFSDKVMSETDKIATYVSEDEILDRVDLREKTIFTIDGKDTKDIDDAIGIELDGDNIILRVSIADVSHYLLQYPSLIKEAVHRGNSAYFADSVVPMLPHKLSNGICSLNPNVDRLTKTVEIVFDKNGDIVSSDVYKSVIRSSKKMNYDDVNAILEDGIIPDGYEEFAGDLILMGKFSELLTSKRNSKGSISFSDLEFKIHTESDGTPTSITRNCHRKAETLIENFMISANIAVTEIYGYLGQPFVYRVHGEPNLAKLKKTVEILREQGTFSPNAINNLLLKIEKNIVRPGDLRPILKEARKLGNIDAVSNLLLRSMQKASYSEANIGHFGLAEEDYSHFTSPIRRAADLLNHIMIDLVMEMNYAQSTEEIEVIQDKLNLLECELPEVCQYISDREVAADQAEREIESLKTIDYLLDNMDYYEGPIFAEVLNINKFGMVILVDNKIKANIDAAELCNLGYQYMRGSRTYVRSKTNDCFKLGTKFYVLDAEVSKSYKVIKYNIAYTMDEYERQYSADKYKVKCLRRTHCLDVK